MSNSPIEKELIRRLKSHSSPIPVKETGIQEHLNKFSDIKAILFDIYGTLVISGSGDIGLTIEENRERAILHALEEAGIQHKLNDSPEVISQYFIEEIEQEHQRKKTNGTDFPEVEIREIWNNLLLKLNAKQLAEPVNNDDQIYILAVEYESHMNPTCLMPGMPDILDFIVEKDIITGIISNAQFFTPLLINALTDKNLDELGFDSGLCYFSYEYGIGKPSIQLFERAKSKLQNQYNIDADQILYVGNDMLNDIMPASKCGFKTALFAGDARSLRLRDEHASVQEMEPDIILTDLNQLKICI